MSILIKGGRVINPATQMEEEADVLIEEDKVVEMKKNIEEKADRVKTLLDTVQYLYRDIKGRRENLSPLFVIGGRYERRNPFFENRIRIENDQINVETLAELLEDDAIRTHTFTGVVTGTFDNENEIRGKLSGESVGATFRHLKEEVEQYYGESN